MNMVTLEKYNVVYEVNKEATSEYYKKHSRINDIKMRNFEKHLPEESPMLSEFLNEFGADIRYPDELCWCWADENKVLHYNVAYTIAGRIVRAEQYETIMYDKSKLHIVLETEYVPNEQAEPYFAFTIYNIEMPWTLDEPFPIENLEEKKKENSILAEMIKKLKKCWTK